MGPYLAASPPLAEEPVQVALLRVPETRAIHPIFMDIFGYIFFGPILILHFVGLRQHPDVKRPRNYRITLIWVETLSPRDYVLASVQIALGHLGSNIIFAEILKDEPAGEDHHGDKSEGEGGLPDLDLVRAVDHEDDQKPDVGEHGEDHRDAEDGEGLDPASLPVRNHDNAGVERRINPINTLPIKEIEAIKTVAAVIESLNICFSKKEDNHDNLTLLTRHT